ncbi:hypothetical protein [Aurantimonas marina]|uniref:hypothetical protein n=1 Tax=Aurantimonas marina TaxID=2780508 RepID=UPI0019D09D0E|nr:hypothetical protein [Aurantimonas marina]
MAKILTFRSSRIQPLTVHSGSKHRVTIKILDEWKPRQTRMIMQVSISDAASFKALNGFTDAAVANGYVHKFSVGRTVLLRRFIADTTDLVSDGLVAIKVDGAMVRPRIKKNAKKVTGAARPAPVTLLSRDQV